MLPIPAAALQPQLLGSPVTHSRHRAGKGSTGRAQITHLAGWEGLKGHLGPAQWAGMPAKAPPAWPWTLPGMRLLCDSPGSHRRHE